MCGGGVGPFPVYYANVTFGATTANFATAAVSQTNYVYAPKSPFIDIAANGTRHISWRDIYMFNYEIWTTTVAGTVSISSPVRFMTGPQVDKPVIRPYRSATASTWLFFENDLGAGRQSYRSTGRDQAAAYSQGAGPSTNPRIATLSDAGSEVLRVLWEDVRSGTRRIYARVADGAEIALSAAGDEAIFPDIAAGINGAFHVVWAQGPSGNRQIYRLRLVP